MDDLFLKVVNLAETGLIVLDPELLIVAWNRYMERISGIRQKEAIGKRLQEICETFQNPEYSRIIENASSGQVPRFCSSRLHKAFVYSKNGYDSSIRQNMMVIPIYSMDKPYVLIQIVDVTYQVNSERALTTLLNEMTIGYSEIKESEELNRRLAGTDPLTGLCNRMTLMNQLQTVFDRAEDRQQYALIFLDLDGFKQINDTYGHMAGDTLLVKIGDRLKIHTRSDDFIARLGGDEFVVMICVKNGRTGAETVAQKLIEEIRKPFIIGGKAVRITGSLGVAMLGDSDTAEKLIQKADDAMYRSKKNGKNTYTFFSDIADEG